MIHAVWGTKNHYPFLITEIKSQVIAHIRQNAQEKKIYIDPLNGYKEHLHCLFGLNADLSLAKILQLLKGESAFWINDHQITSEKFEWADEYYAVSVSESHLAYVRQYIHGQEEHHKKVTFQQEYERFMDKYKFKRQG
jgi:putative transposase